MYFLRISCVKLLTVPRTWSHGRNYEDLIPKSGEYTFTWLKIINYVEFSRMTMILEFDQKGHPYSLQ
jgi:hypothetical protein